MTYKPTTGALLKTVADGFNAELSQGKDPFIVELEELIAKHGLDSDIGIPKDILALSTWEEFQFLMRVKDFK